MDSIERNNIHDHHFFPLGHIPGEPDLAHWSTFSPLTLGNGLLRIGDEGIGVYD